VIAIGADASSGTAYAFTYIGGIYDSLVDDRPVYIRSDGALGTLVSSRRYKEEIKPMGKASEALFALKPVTFRYRQEIDPSDKLSFSLIAEDVAEISTDLVSRDKEGKPQTVRYEAVNAMLLNEFLKEHRKVEEQEATISQLKKEFQTAVAQQQKEIQALTAQLKEHAAQSRK
jgi:Chaperone of endosialidase